MIADLYLEDSPTFEVLEAMTPTESNHQYVFDLQNNLVNNPQTGCDSRSDSGDAFIDAGRQHGGHICYARDQHETDAVLGNQLLMISPLYRRCSSIPKSSPMSTDFYSAPSQHAL
jgi:hypothetical protein